MRLHIHSYIQSVECVNHSTAKLYSRRIKKFNAFAKSEYQASADKLIELIKNGQDPYNIINQYIRYLKYNHNLSPLSLKQEVITVENLLEYSDIEISPRKFKLKIKLPKIIRKSKQALSKEDIINILNSCEIRLKTYIMLLGSTGMRAGEALSIRIKDLDLDSNPAKVQLRGEVTKTRTDRTIFLTDEVSRQLKAWIDYKHRARRVSHFDTISDKYITSLRRPEKNEFDLVFAARQTMSIHNVYINLCLGFERVLDRLHMSQKEEFTVNPTCNKKHHRRRQITLHSFRRFVKTTISDLGYGDFGEYFIGHSGSTYYRKTEKEKIQLFRKIEPHLTFLDYPTLERKGADIEAKVENLEQENQRLRHSDQIKEDALATLSDQVMRLMVEVQQLKGR
jgi:integrase